MTTIVQGRVLGSGFFYTERGNEIEKKKPGTLYESGDIWLITNRHIVLGKLKDGPEKFPDTLSFKLRQVVKNDIKWIDVKLAGDDIINRMKQHKNHNLQENRYADLLAIRITDSVTNRLLGNTSNIIFNTISKSDFPEENNVNVESAEEVLLIGYPRIYYDTKNKFPIVRQGIIASKWKSWFQGFPIFKIDSKALPGSSGSIVITKPRAVGNIKNNRLKIADLTKRFYFLGINSGEIQNERKLETSDISIVAMEKLDLHTIWYNSMIEETIKEGVEVSLN